PRDPQFHAGLDEGLDQLVLAADRRAPDRTVGAMESALALDGVLEALEIGKNVCVAPAGVAGCGPGVVVLALAADGDQAIDRTRASQRFSPRPVDLASIHPSFGLGIKAPVD